MGRCIAAALGAVCMLASPVIAVEPSNFAATTTRDLIALCSDEFGDALYLERGPSYVLDDLPRTP